MNTKNLIHHYRNFFTNPKDFFIRIKGTPFLQLGLYPFLIHFTIIALGFFAIFQSIISSGDPGIIVISFFIKVIYTIYIYLFFPPLYYFTVNVFSSKNKIRIQDSYNMFSFLTVFIPIASIISAIVNIGSNSQIMAITEILLFLVPFYYIERSINGFLGVSTGKSLFILPLLSFATLVLYYFALEKILLLIVLGL